MVQEAVLLLSYFTLSCLFLSHSHCSHLETTSNSEVWDLRTATKRNYKSNTGAILLEEVASHRDTIYTIYFPQFSVKTIFAHRNSIVALVLKTDTLTTRDISWDNVQCCYSRSMVNEILQADKLFSVSVRYLVVHSYGKKNPIKMMIINNKNMHSEGQLQHDQLFLFLNECYQNCAEKWIYLNSVQV